MSQDLVPVGSWNDDLDDGLGDLAPSDLRVPRLNIKHGSEEMSGHIIDNLSGAGYREMGVIVLGLVKGRVMWPPTVEENSSPLCKSTDFETGYPTTNKSSARDNFPWTASGWQPSDFPPNTEGQIVLPCSTCKLKEWDTHPNGKKSWCAEQWHVPMLYAMTPDEDPSSLAIMTFQRSSVAAAKNYLSNFARSNTPAYSRKARIKLRAEKRGQNTYFVPYFESCGETDTEKWPDFSRMYREIREYLRRKPPARDADGNIISAASVAAENTMAAPAQPTQQPAQPAYQAPVQPAYVPEPTPQPVTVPATTARDDDDLPF